MRTFLSTVPSGSGKGGKESWVPVGGDILLESKSTNHISSGNLNKEEKTFKNSKTSA